MTDAAERRALLADVPADTWLARHWSDHRPNVTGAERWLSIAGGVGIAALLGRRRDLPGALGALFGAGLVIRGLTGQCAVKRAMAKGAGDNPKRRVARAHGWSQAALIHAATTVGKPRQDCYEMWRDFSNLGKFMENVVSVEVLDDKTSHWTVKAPLGRTVEWDAVVTEDIPGERIAWETAPGADIKSIGWVEFKDAVGGRGTEVRARFAYAPPAGKVGQVAAKLMQREPTVQARRDLRRFKSFMETGEIAVSHVPGIPATSADLRL